MTTVLNAPPASKHLFSYHDIGENPIQYGPEFVFEDGGFSNLQAGPIK
jgi:hypothetical protein